MEKQPTLVFITGGVRSGKSTFAEKLSTALAQQSSGCLHYVATGTGTDMEMQQRILIHQQQRSDCGHQWITHEQERNIATLSSVFKKEDIVLLDCVTTWLTNEWFAGGDNWKIQSFQKEVMRKIEQGIQAITDSCKTLIIVSNEVGFEFQDDELVLTYKKLLGKIHQWIVKDASHAYLVEMGIPIVKKGDSRLEKMVKYELD